MAIRDALRLSPGIADAALSSLAGFAASLYAVRFLDGPELGAFALYLSASVVGGLIPHQLLLLPAQVAVLDLAPAQRPSMLGWSLRRGVLLSLLVAPFVAMTGLLLGGRVDAEALLPLAVGAALLTSLVPMQDHVRSTLYLAARPERAALMSGCQFGLTLAALTALHVSDTTAAWVPFTALAVGSAGSMGLGLVLASVPRGLRDEPGIALSTRRLLRMGKPLLPAALVQEGTVFGSNAILVALTSPAVLGAAEAARIIARPVQALSLGISRSLAPRLMQAGRDRSLAAARSAFLLYAGSLGVAGLAYLAVAAWSYPYSPLVALLPAAYENDGLVALFLLATVLGAVSQIPRAVLLGAGEGNAILFVTVVASGVRLAAVALLAMAVDAYALPLAHLASLAAGGWLGARAAKALLR